MKKLATGILAFFSNLFGIYVSQTSTNEIKIFTLGVTHLVRVRDPYMVATWFILKNQSLMSAQKSAEKWKTAVISIWAERQVDACLARVSKTLDENLLASQGSHLHSDVSYALCFKATLQPIQAVIARRQKMWDLANERVEFYKRLHA